MVGRQSGESHEHEHGYVSQQDQYESHATGSGMLHKVDGKGAADGSAWQ